MTQPEKVKTPGPAPPGPSASTTTINGQQTANTQESTTPVRRLCARRAASQRLEGGDPWSYPPPGERGYQAAALHLLEVGLLPAADREGLRLMYRRGGSCRQAAEFIAERWDMAA